MLCSVYKDKYTYLWGLVYTFLAILLPLSRDCDPSEQICFTY